MANRSARESFKMAMISKWFTTGVGALRGSVFENRDGCPKVRSGVVPELQHQRVAIEHRLDNPALHAASATVHQADFGQTRRRGGMHVFVDDRRNIARREGMQVDFG